MSAVEILRNTLIQTEKLYQHEFHQLLKTMLTNSCFNIFNRLVQLFHIALKTDSFHSDLVLILYVFDNVVYEIIEV